MKYIIIGVAVFLVLLAIALITVPSFCVYIITLKRGKKERWSRSDTHEMNPVIKKGSEEWYEAHKHLTREVQITSGGLRLYGEYYDLGNKRCMMLLSGRTESLIYGYYFAQPYEESGYNILVVDPRAHGKSDGQFNTVGFEESKDALAWARFLHDEMGMEEILFHGICIGSAGGILALTSEDCPDYIVGLVAEGMFPNFNESVKNHMIERNKPTGIVLEFVDIWMRLFTGHSMKFGPIDVIGSYRKPLLMIHSREDNYSTPENAQKLFDKCPSEAKELFWYEKGKHSMLRPDDPESYDGAIKRFINKNFK